MRYRIAYLLIVPWLMLASTAMAQDKGNTSPKDDTETVISTFHVKEGKEAEFAKVLEQAWSTYHRLGMVLPQPNLVLRGVETAGKPYFIEIFTWKDHDAPDHAPAEVRTIWAQMEALCERRDGHRGIEFTEMQIVAPQK
jgi:hypothetical protein